MNRALKQALCGAFGAAIFLIAALPSVAEDFYCEVMALEGTATVSNETTSGKALVEGDLLKEGDTLEVAADSYVDLAYDREWNNITRVEENTKISVLSIYPTVLDLDSGGVYAKLKKLPKESSFDVQTPTAIASVRGTEYRTTVLEGETQIYNASDSDVLVYGLDESGQKQAEPVILKNSQKTQVQKRGMSPVAPRPMETRDFQPVQRAREKIENRIQKNVAQGRMGKIQNIEQMERMGPPQGRSSEGRLQQPGSGALTSMEGGRKPRQEAKIPDQGPAREGQPPASNEKKNYMNETRQNGQPFGPDPGRRPQDGQQKNGQQKHSDARPAPKAGPRQNHP